MECEERKRRLSGWILLALAVGQLWLLRSADAEAMEGEFVAGSFILTQKSLNEAPYREEDHIEFYVLCSTDPTRSLFRNKRCLAFCPSPMHSAKLEVT